MIHTSCQSKRIDVTNASVYRWLHLSISYRTYTSILLTAGNTEISRFENQNEVICPEKPNDPVIARQARMKAFFPLTTVTT